mgnify:CR=1 FL=1|tara:strand:- start:9796 stop:10128 length:333 start_codon:yes stop_codon:yes gene_type:complete
MSFVQMESDTEGVVRGVRLEDCVEVSVILDEAAYGKGLPTGIANSVRDGYAFYYMFKKGEEQVIKYITSQINDSPTITAVNKNQYDKWLKRGIIAKAVKFYWQGDIWQVR